MTPPRPPVTTTAPPRASELADLLRPLEDPMGVRPARVAVADDRDVRLARERPPVRHGPRAPSSARIDERSYGPVRGRGGCASGRRDRPRSTLGGAGAFDKPREVGRLASRARQRDVGPERVGRHRRPAPAQRRAPARQAASRDRRRRTTAPARGRPTGMRRGRRSRAPSAHGPPATPRISQPSSAMASRSGLTDAEEGEGQVPRVRIGPAQPARSASSRATPSTAAASAARSVVGRSGRPRSSASARSSAVQPRVDDRQQLRRAR